MRANIEMSHFAQTILNGKYAHTKPSGHKESWPEIAHRVAYSVMNGAETSRIERVRKFVEARKIMPGGRYLYAAGRRYPQINNCFLCIAEDSREGWADTMYKNTTSLMTGGGVGNVYSKLRGKGTLVGGMGGFSTGPCALMQMVNEAGRHIMQGGQRRSALWGGLHWWHPDIFDFIKLKNWSPEVQKLKRKDFNFPAPMDGTNISVCLDGKFFEAYFDFEHPQHQWAFDVYWTVVEQMCRTGEPGFSVDIGSKELEWARNAPVVGSTYVLTDTGYKQVNDLVDTPSTVWTGRQWANNVVFTCTKRNSPTVEVKMTGGRSIRCEPSHEFLVERYKVAGKPRKLISVDRIQAQHLKPGDQLHVSLPQVKQGALDQEAYVLGYLYGDGNFTSSGKAEVTVCTVAKRAALPALVGSTRFSSITDPDSRGYALVYYKTDQAYWSGRDKSVFPAEIYTAGSSKIASFLAGLFDADGNWDPDQKRIRLSSNRPEFLRGVARCLEQLGILSNVSKNGTCSYSSNANWQLVIASDCKETFAKLIPTKRLAPNLTGYKAYRRSTVKVQSVTNSAVEDVYCCDVGVKEHSFMAEGVIISNCTEVTSPDDGDMCNLVSLNLARFASIDEFETAVDSTVDLMLHGTVYSPLPLERMYKIREKNRRLGLGLMGIHEWLLKRGKPYGPDDELAKWMEVYASAHQKAAARADRMNLSRPVGTRAIAPNGTIAIVAETTSAIEPIFAVAQKRRYLNQSMDNVWKYQYIIDACAQRIIDSGVDPDLIEDAYDLAEDYERRIKFQAWTQQYVDHGISSTVNMPKWGSSVNNEHTIKHFGETLIKYLPEMRGITVYPDGARDGQPLNRVSYREAIKHLGKEYAEEGEVTAVIQEFGNERSCVNGVCGI